MKHAKLSVSDRNRTYDPLLRRQMLYPTELQRQRPANIKGILTLAGNYETPQHTRSPTFHNVSFLVLIAARESNDAPSLRASYQNEGI